MSSNYFFTQNGQVIPFDDVFAKTGPFSEGNLWVWGDNTNSNLGINANTNRSTPVTTFTGGTNWKQISCTTSYASAIKTDGTLWTWGFGNYGQLGINNNSTIRSTPVTTFAGGTNWKQVACGYSHIAAIKTDGTLWTWGFNSYGKLGTNDARVIKNTPIQVSPGTTNWKQISCGTNHTAAIKTDGTLWTWGDNARGQLGINVISPSDAIENYSATPVTTFIGGNNWKQVLCKAYHTIATKTDGTLWVWGSNYKGQLGTNKVYEEYEVIVRTPITTFAGGNNWINLSRTGGIKSDGTLWVWGRNPNGALGTNNTLNTLTPVTTFSGGTNWKQLSMKFSSVSDIASDQLISSAAIKADGTLWVWGDNTDGHLGTNTGFNILTPVTTFAGGTNWRQVSLGYGHAAAIKADGTLWVWGRNDQGQLGINNIINRSTPVTTFTGGTNWKQVSCGSLTTSAIKTDGSLWTWGSNDYGKLGRGLDSITLPVQSTPSTVFGGGNNWRQVSCGSIHLSAIKTDGTLWTWGYTTYLGINQSTSILLGGNRNTPVTTFAGGNNWNEVFSGKNSTIATKTDGTLWVWGTDYDLMSENIPADLTTTPTPETDPRNRLTPVTTFAGETNWKISQVSYGEIAAGPTAYSSAAIKTDGTLWTWGRNNSGQIGINAVTNRSTPVTTFAGGTNWKQVAYGYQHTGAIKTDGTLWLWGDNALGQVGINNTAAGATAIATPVTTFLGGTNWKQIACGQSHSAAIKTDGTLWTWGGNNNGALGTNNTIHRSTPVTTFTGGNDWKQVSCGNEHTIAIKTDGTLWGWGLNSDGQLGNNTSSGRLTPVTTFTGGNDWRLVACGNNHTLAIKNNGSLWVWGDNNFGQLGINDLEDRSIPVTTFAGGTNWKQVAGSAQHSAAIKLDGTLWVWGSGSNGRLGLGINDIADRYTPITTILGGTNWKQIGCGYTHNVAIKNNGTLWTWGANLYGQIGDNTITNIRYTPVTTFLGGTNWKQEGDDYEFSISANSIGSALKNDGTLWTWGVTNYGVLGNNFEPELAVNGRTPITTFAGGNDWNTFAAGYDNSVAIKTNGSLWIWGNTLYILDNELQSKYTPVPLVSNENTWKSVSLGYSHIATIKTDGTLWTWGDSGLGQLGNNTSFQIGTPITTTLGRNDWRQVECGFNYTTALNYVDPVL